MGINDGELFSTVLTGGTPNFMYSIDAISDIIQQDCFLLGSGTDSLYIIDSLGCEYSYLYEINEPDSIMVSVVAQEPSCYGYCDGIVEAIVMGTNNYNLIWSDFSSALVRHLCDGLISLTVLDSLGCSNFYPYNLQYTTSFSYYYSKWKYINYKYKFHKLSMVRPQWSH